MARSTGLLPILVALVACNAPQTPLSEETVDQTYQVRYLDGRKGADPYQLVVFVRPMELRGKLAVCGAYVADMSDTNFGLYSQSFHDMNTFLRFGAPDTHRPVVHPGFLRATRATLAHGPDGRLRLPLGVSAGCVVTETDWNDDYAHELFTLELKETRIKPLFLPYR